MDDSNDNHPLFSDNVSSILLAVGLAVFLITIYHLLSFCFCNQHLYITNQDHTTTNQPPIAAAASVSHLIPTHKYEKKNKKKQHDLEDGDDEDCTCAVCLGDFEEGEDLKTLPECMHSFHMSCIDMWLHSHSTCPTCRTEATPNCSGHDQLNNNDRHHLHHNIEMMQIAIFQDRLGRG